MKIFIILATDGLVLVIQTSLPNLEKIVSLQTRFEYEVKLSYITPGNT